MKRIFIIDVPDWWNENTGIAELDFYNDNWFIKFDQTEIKEFIPPTDDEIERGFNGEQEEAQVSYLLSEGAKWFKKSLLGLFDDNPPMEYFENEKIIMDAKFKTPSKDEVKEMLFKIKPDYKDLPDNILQLIISIYRLGWVECREAIVNALINKP